MCPQLTKTTQFRNCGTGWFRACWDISQQFIRKVHKYEDLTGLTSRSLRDLVSGIYVSAPDKSTGKRRQSIHIKYDGIGFIPLDELMERETA